MELCKTLPEYHKCSFCQGMSHLVLSSWNLVDAVGILQRDHYCLGEGIDPPIRWVRELFSINAVD
jgi:hypothetical protein